MCYIRAQKTHLEPSILCYTEVRDPGAITTNRGTSTLFKKRSQRLKMKKEKKEKNTRRLKKQKNNENEAKEEKE